MAAIGLMVGAEDTVAPCKFYGILASGRGLVLIARRSCDLAQLVLAEGCGIVVEPGEATELADRLQALAGDPASVMAMGQNSRRLYERQFGLERSLEHYDHLLQAVGSAPPPGPNRRS
jgi:glycosyltransferase involved in cell wall biosynthesis